MKMTALLTLVSLPILSLSALATEPPVLSRTSTSGFVSPSMKRETICQIYEDRIELSQSLGAISSRRVVPQSLGGDIHGLIEAARTGEIAPGRGVPDTGLLSYSAILPDGEHILLKSAGSRGASNRAPAAATLSA